MSLSARDYGFPAGLALVTVLLSAITASQTWYLNILLAMIVPVVLYMTREWKDRGFYLVCAAIPTVIACGMMNLAGGLIAACMAAGLFCSVLGLLSTRGDQNLFAAFCGISIVITLLLGFSNHVVLPLIILGIAAASILAIISIRMYRVRKHYTGAAP